jgi:hypothetical protein
LGKLLLQSCMYQTSISQKSGIILVDRPTIITNLKRHQTLVVAAINYGQLIVQNAQAIILFFMK